jgi:hypothetical protein
MGLIIPSSTLHLQADTIAAVLWSLVAFIDHIVGPFILDDEGELKLINGDLVLSSKVLLGTGDEGLWEHELVKPENVWESVSDPLGDEYNSTEEIIEPGSQWLQGQETILFVPLEWDLVIEQSSR